LSAPLVPAASAVVFDFDGVIVDSRRAVRTAVGAALGANGVADRPDAEVDQVIGPPVRWAFASLTGAAEESELVSSCVDAYHRVYEAVYLEQTALVPGLDRALAGLGVPAALATAKVEDFVGPLLARLGLTGRFDAVAAPSRAVPDEPKASIVARALDALGDAAADAVMVGDRSYDIAAARTNGIRSVGVLWGIGDRAELTGAGADLIVTRVGELADVLGGSG
jgi:phosphoglycolate phosphatase